MPGFLEIKIQKWVYEQISESFGLTCNTGKSQCLCICLTQVKSTLHTPMWFVLQEEEFGYITVIQKAVSGLMAFLSKYPVLPIYQIYTKGWELCFSCRSHSWIELYALDWRFLTWAPWRGLRGLLQILSTQVSSDSSALNGNAEG